MCGFFELFRTTGELRCFIVLMQLRCPFDALNTVVISFFLQCSFQAIERDNLYELYMACLIYGVGSLILFIYNGTMWTVCAAFFTKLVGTLRGKVFEHISGISLQQMEARPSGEWLTRLNSDVQSVSAIFFQPIHLIHIVVSVVNICVSAVILVCMNPPVSALVVLFLIPHMLINQMYVSKPMTKLAAAVQEATAVNTTDMGALIACADTAILYDAQGFLLSRFEKSSLAIREENMKIRRRQAAGSAILPVMGMSGYFVILLVGGMWIADGKMTFGELTAAFQYSGGVLVGSMMFVNSLINMKISLAGVRRVNETMSITLVEQER